MQINSCTSPNFKALKLDLNVPKALKLEQVNIQKKYIDIFEKTALDLKDTKYSHLEIDANLNPMITVGKMKFKLAKVQLPTNNMINMYVKLVDNNSDDLLVFETLSKEEADNFYSAIQSYSSKEPGNNILKSSKAVKFIEDYFNKINGISAKGSFFDNMSLRLDNLMSKHGFKEV